MSPTLISEIAGGLRPAPARSSNSGAWFEGDGPAPRPSDRVFFLLYPTEDAARQITRLAWRFCDKYQLPGGPPAAERLHASVHFLCRFGRLTSAALAEIDKAIAGVTMPPFLVGWDWVGNFGEKEGPLVLRGDEGVAGIMMLRNELVATTRMIGFRPGRRDFTPHVTLNYNFCSVPRQTVEEIRWTVRELVLVCSLQGRRCHRVLRRWRLRGRGPARLSLGDGPHCARDERDPFTDRISALLADA